MYIYIVFPAFLSTLMLVASFAPLFLIAAACVWTARHGRTLRPARMLAFCAGLIAGAISYAAHFVLTAYLRGAHLDFWQELRVGTRVGDLMIIVAVISFGMNLCGKGYGRVTACFASVLISVSWYLSQVLSF